MSESEQNMYSLYIRNNEGKGKIAMTVTTAKWTIEEYHRMVDAGIFSDRHVELLNGEIIQMSGIALMRSI